MLQKGLAVSDMLYVAGSSSSDYFKLNMISLKFGVAIDAQYD